MSTHSCHMYHIGLFDVEEKTGGITIPWVTIKKKKYAFIIYHNNETTQLQFAHKFYLVFYFFNE